MRHAIEVRHPSFRTEQFEALLRRHGFALVVADTAERYPLFDVTTTDFVYARLHGQGELYAGGYDEASLRTWAERIESWNGRDVGDGRKRDVFVYFDNDAKVRAPVDAATLERLLSDRTTKLRSA
jgi:uncharacterized protein YecE (DUF72 family)